ncbi:imelysin family protein [Oceaniglobus roseus]|uniref:imelysin family protein n=1 Tax=Oceaniglobus roseus TaxID=1737570 RepID=UPI000C7F60A7|nr:imelysin family protein [Kandeliimicrobium roseum]
MYRLALTLTAAGACAAGSAMAQDRAAALTTYADIAEAAYADSLSTAERLKEAIATLVETPSPQALQAAKEAWLQSRVPYQQTEVYRFGNPIVDDWEGKVNAWPLDEGLIDYVAFGGATDENAYGDLNVIATPTFTLSGQEVDASVITPALLEDTLQEADANEANVATGYHAIEFLLWGQDLNGTGPGAGQRPWTDYAQGEACTNGNCDRRAEYLEAAADLLVLDLQDMVAAWGADGEARKAVTADTDAGLRAILTGMGSLAYGELAGQRMKLGLMLNDPEEEHDCFSDNTHNAAFYDGLGIRNVYLGSYTRVDGTVVEGPSLSELVAAADPEVDALLRADLDATMEALRRIKTAAEAGFSWDMMLARGSDAGEALIMGGVDALVKQTRGVERAVRVLDLGDVTLEGSDSLDNAAAVFE